MKTITKIDVLGLAKIVSFVEGIIGLILGFIGYFLMLGIQNTPDANSLENQLGFSSFGPWVIVLYPILYAIVGFIGGALVAYLYNIFSAKWGGLKINIK